ncbi:MAG TPA: FtsX-like permease family protein [Balneolaceae bacterium]|nr:FtsX-like permease family protein [Balneolaceae bacterium]
MKSTGFIARRYLFSRKHISLISTLTIISILGVTLGTALLIVVLSVFNGFFKVIKGFLLNNDPDVRIESAEGQPFIYQKHVQQELQNIPEITAISPYIAGKALLAAGKNRNQVVSVKGIEPQSYGKINNLRKNITKGHLDLSVKNRHPGLLISNQLMSDLGLSIGDEVALLSAKGMRNSLTEFSMPRVYRFRVAGTYSYTQIVQSPSLFIDMRAARRLFDYRNTISGVDLRLQNNEQANDVKKRLKKELGSKYKISTWYDLQKPLYDVMHLEKWGSYLILMIIVLVAVFNIVGSLTMIVIQKNRDIGVLLTIGYTPAEIRTIFLKQGLYIGLIGCGLGGGLGLLFSWLQKKFGLIKLTSAFLINAYPVSIHVWDVVVVLVGSLLLCLLASWYPARRAAKVEPADAVRYE